MKMSPQRRYANDIRQIRKKFHIRYRDAQAEYRRAKEQLQWSRRTDVLRRAIVAFLHTPQFGPLKDVWPPKPELLTGEVNEAWTKELRPYADCNDTDLYDVYVGCQVTKVYTSGSDKDPTWQIGDTRWVWHLHRKGVPRAVGGMLTREKIQKEYTNDFPAKKVDSLSDVYCVGLRPHKPSSEYVNRESKGHRKAR